MMIININNGTSLLIFFAITFAVIVLLMLLRPGQRGQKMLSIVIIIVSFSVVYFMFGRPAQISINETGVHSETYGKINFSWTDINQAEIINNYDQTEWKPALKINGSGLIGFRSGRYKLKNGERAMVLTRKSDNAVIFRTDDELYLLALNDFDEFLSIASEYIEF